MGEALESEEEPLDFEENRECLLKFESSRIQYKREFLLEYSHVDVCRKLPTDFDLIILSELDDASAGKAEHRKISGSSLCDGLLHSIRSNLDLPDKRWDGSSLMLKKDGQSPVTFYSERSCVVSSYSPEETGYAAGILGPKSQKSDPFPLSKCEIPYLPPHCRKEKSLLQQHPICIHKTEATCAAVLDGNSTTKGSHVTKDASDKISGSMKPSHVPCNVTGGCVALQNLLKLSDADRITQRTVAADPRNNDLRITQINQSSVSLQVTSGYLNNISEKVLQPVDASPELGLGSSRNSYISAKGIEGRNLIDIATGDDCYEYDFPILNLDDLLNSSDCESDEDDEIKFDDVWAEISLQMEELKLTHLSTSEGTPDSEVEICLPDEDSLALLDQSHTSTVSRKLNSISTDNHDDVTSSDSEINLPDEDNLITLEDLIAPYTVDDLIAHRSSMSAIYRDSNESDISGSVTHKQHSLRAHSESYAAFIPATPPLYPANDQVNYPSRFVTQDTTHFAPTLGCYTYPNFHIQPFEETTLGQPNINDTLVHYSLFEQPFICPDQRKQLWVDATGCKPNKQVTSLNLNSVKFFPWIPPTSAVQHFGNPNAACLFPAVGDLADQIASYTLNADGAFRYSCPFPVLQPHFRASPGQ